MFNDWDSIFGRGRIEFEGSWKKYMVDSRFTKTGTDFPETPEEEQLRGTLHNLCNEANNAWAKLRRVDLEALMLHARNELGYLKVLEYSSNIDFSFLGEESYSLFWKHLLSSAAEGGFQPLMNGYKEFCSYYRNGIPFDNSFEYYQRISQFSKKIQNHLASETDIIPTSQVGRLEKIPASYGLAQDLQPFKRTRASTVDGERSLFSISRLVINYVEEFSQQTRQKGIISKFSPEERAKDSQLEQIEPKWIEKLISEFYEKDYCMAKTNPSEKELILELVGRRLSYSRGISRKGNRMCFRKCMHSFKKTQTKCATKTGQHASQATLSLPHYSAKAFDDIWWESSRRTYLSRLSMHKPRFDTILLFGDVQKKFLTPEINQKLAKTTEDFDAFINRGRD
ncbi:hypothetical protein H4Q26_014716 [Puccinia striiformis f. sp. tritici PST-130]|nr:hypothetical protein H4Q26_014716 [Puccinia striiformis f. sp. tritici PST-130]